MASEASNRLPTCTCPDCNRVFKSAYAAALHRRDTHLNPNWVPSKTAPKPQAAPICPMCGEAASLSEGKYGTKAECCGLWSWGLKPLVSRGTHRARIAAHAAFDELWRSGQLLRGEAYRRLADAMGMTRVTCHISMMDMEQAERVVEIVQSGALLTERAAA